MGIKHVGQSEALRETVYAMFAKDAHTGDSGSDFQSEATVDGSGKTRSRLTGDPGRNLKRPKHVERKDGKEGSGDPATRMVFSPAGRIASKYDLVRITPNEVFALADDLLEAELISFDTHAYLSFQPKLTEDHSRLIEPLTEKTPADQPFNLLENLQETLAIQKDANASQTAIERTESLVKLMTNLNYMGNLGL